MKTLMSFLVISCMLLACSDETLQQQTIEQDIVADSTKKELPPGYTILCNPERTQYLPVMPSGYRLYKNKDIYLGYESYELAATEAWEMYIYSLRPPAPTPLDTVTWQKCLFNEALQGKDSLADAQDLSATATLSGKNISAEKWETMRKRDEQTKRVYRDGSHLNNTNTGNTHWEKSQDASTDVLLTFGSNNIAADIDSGKIPIIKKRGNKSWTINFEWPAMASVHSNDSLHQSYLEFFASQTAEGMVIIKGKENFEWITLSELCDSIKNLQKVKTIADLLNFRTIPEAGESLYQIDGQFIWADPATARYLDSLKSAK